MKLDENYLKKCYHDAAVLQLSKQLRAEGFVTYTEYEIKYQSINFSADLYAEKNDEKRIYEFKLIGNKKHQQGLITKLKKVAKEIGAEAFVIYVNPPVEKSIDFDDLGSILTEYFCNNDIPNDLDILSTHTSIDIVEVDDITYCGITGDCITVSGNATINVELQWGSDHDSEIGDGLIDYDGFPMSFTVKLDFDFEINDIDFAIDTSDWFGKD
jgi:hypothetical protein